MKLEKKSDQVLPFSKFLGRMIRYLFFATALIVLSVAFGTIGYHHFARIGWMESFEMACMILTGMGPIAPMTTNGAKLFSSIYALYSGVAFLSITAVFFAPLIHRLLHILNVEDE